MTRPVTDLDAVLRPIAQANGLPNAHYTDAAVHAEETQALLMQEWAGLAVTADVPEPGDAKPLTFLGIPLLLIRDKDGDVRVFQNICRHRGMILVDSPRKIEGAIRCPYHSWCYSTKGKLVSTPHVGGPGQNTHPDIKRDELGLFEVRSHIWRDVVFINLSRSAAPFEEVHAELIARWAPFEQPQYHAGDDSRMEMTVESNWKLAVENYCESYHLPWVHPGLNSYSRLEDHYNIVKYGRYSGQGVTTYTQIRGEDGAVFPDFANLPPEMLEGGEYAVVYPNVLLGVQRDHTFAIILEPKGPATTTEHIHLFYATPETDGALRRKNKDQWQVVFAEDIGVVEGMMRGRYAIDFDGGRFSPEMDGATHCFHDWVANKMQSWRAKQRAAE